MAEEIEAERGASTRLAVHDGNVVREGDLIVVAE